MIKERPILFTAPMVRAILNGNKTQTRRKISKDNLRIMLGGFDSPPHWVKPNAKLLAAALTNAHNLRCIEHLLTWETKPEPHQVSGFWAGRPTYAAGDQLWVKETFHYDTDLDEYFYKADSDLNVKWKPSIFMPRKASRILLEITNVRVERLNDISGTDAMAEGLNAISKDGLRTIKYGIPDADGHPGTDNVGWPWAEWEVSPVAAYKKLWELINGKGSWDLKPWVWIIEFEVISK
jgi:hypothetical protein